MVNIDLNFSLVQHNLSNELSTGDCAVPFTAGICRLVQAAAPPGFPDTFPLMNNLHNDYRGKPHEPSPYAVPGAQGRPGQSIPVSAQGVADRAVCSQWGTPDPESLSGMQERGGCTTVGGKGSVPSAAGRTKLVGTGGRSQTATSAGEQESIGATTHRPSPPSLPHQLRTYPSRDGDLTQLTPSQHGTWRSSHLARATQPTPPTSVQQVCGKSKMDPPSNAASPQTFLGPSSISTPSQAEPSAAQERSWVTGTHCPTDTHHLSRLQD